MTALLEAVARARDAQTAAKQAFRKTLVQARKHHTWTEIAVVAKMSRQGVIWLADNLEERRKDAERRKRRKEKT